MAVAVLIVNYHAYEELTRALVSVQSFIDSGDEVVVVDHESDAVQARRLADRFPTVRLLPRADNPGFAAGVNAAAAVTSASHLLLLNPDAIVESPVIRTLERWLVAHPGTGIVGPRVLNADGSVQPSARRFPTWSTGVAGRTTWLTRTFPDNPWSARNLPGRGADAPLDVDWIAGSCLMTPRSVFDALGGFDDRFFLYWEDADYGRRAALRGWRSTYLPEVTVRHLGGRSASHNLAGSIAAFHASAFRLYWKHATGLSRAMAPCVWAGLQVRAQWLLLRERRSHRDPEPRSKSPGYSE